MERLTKTYSDGSFGVADKLPCGENRHAFKKLLIDTLGAYETAEEQGLLVRLPCELEYGIMIYHIEETENSKWIGNKPIQSFTKTEVLCGFGFGMIPFEFSEYGKTWFTKRESAEVALKEMEKGNE